jgi:hypothetical protein
LHNLARAAIWQVDIRQVDGFLAVPVNMFPLPALQALQAAVGLAAYEPDAAGLTF